MIGEEMKFLAAIFLLAFAEACASKKDVEVTMIRVTPIELAVEVVLATPRFDSAPDRYMILLRVLGPTGKRGATLHLLVDNLSEHRRAFIGAGTRWIIRCDEEAFEHEKSIGFSFWSFGDLHPKELPIQLAEPTSGLAPALAHRERS